MNGGAVAVIEWAERVAPLLPGRLPSHCLSAATTRTSAAVTIHASGPLSQTLLAALRRRDAGIAPRRARIAPKTTTPGLAQPPDRPGV